MSHYEVVQLSLKTLDQYKGVGNFGTTFKDNVNVNMVVTRHGQ